MKVRTQNTARTKHSDATISMSDDVDVFPIDLNQAAINQVFVLFEYIYDNPDRFCFNLAAAQSVLLVDYFLHYAELLRLPVYMRQWMQDLREELISLNTKDNYAFDENVIIGSAKFFVELRQTGSAQVFTYVSKIIDYHKEVATPKTKIAGIRPGIVVATPVETTLKAPSYGALKELLADAYKSRGAKPVRPKGRPRKQPVPLGVRATCINCKLESDVGVSFGTRVMRGVVKPQPWCIGCRTTGEKLQQHDTMHPTGM